jgi:hypothetical protein
MTSTTISRARRRTFALIISVIALLGTASVAHAVIVRTRTAVAVRPVAYHPVARTAAVVGTAAVTAAVVGSVVHSLPPSCSQVVVGNVAYQQCGNSWYRPQYAGSQVTYVVVNPPR